MLTHWHLSNIANSFSISIKDLKKKLLRQLIQNQIKALKRFPLKLLVIIKFRLVNRLSNIKTKLPTPSPLESVSEHHQ